MKEQELREHAKCSCCGKGIGHTGLPLFWTVEIKRHGLEAGALRRSAGLTMMLGSAALAAIMGPDEEMTREMLSRDLTLCETCAMPIMELLELCPESEEEAVIECIDRTSRRAEAESRLNGERGRRERGDE